MIVKIKGVSIKLIFSCFKATSHKLNAFNKDLKKEEKKQQNSLIDSSDWDMRKYYIFHIAPKFINHVIYN